jgi:hypothetical protein
MYTLNMTKSGSNVVVKRDICEPTWRIKASKGCLGGGIGTDVSGELVD